MLTASGQTLLPVLNQGCSSTVKAAVDAAVAASPNKSLTDFIPANPFSNALWAALFTANDPSQITKPTKVPLLIIQGGNDEQIPVVTTQALAQHFCTIGQHTERWVYSGQSHAGVITPSYNDMLHWIADRFATKFNVKSPIDPYVPTANGNASITIDQSAC